MVDTETIAINRQYSAAIVKRRAKICFPADRGLVSIKAPVGARPAGDFLMNGASDSLAMILSNNEAKWKIVE